mmetsp:Transcript_10488/g.33542  ORF Transcript_10488/g.33542 Transcript_10488/m.33542 type:complete len:368 (+) Transcript_10488:1733-2836(+)
MSSLRSTSLTGSSIKMALSGLDLDILAWPSASPYSMWCDRITGLSLRPMKSQYSRANMFTLRWSTPSWQMSARRKKMSVHCMIGYSTCAAVSLFSSRPMIWQHFLMRAMVNRLVMSSIWSQYGPALSMMSSEAHRNSTLSRSMPAPFHTSIKYWPTTLILSRSPPILSFIRANQSATQNTNRPPAEVHLFTLSALKMPCAMCMRPLGSNPSYSRKLGFLLTRFRRSSSVTHSSPTLRSSWNRRSASSGLTAGAAGAAGAAAFGFFALSPAPSAFFAPLLVASAFMPAAVACCCCCCCGCCCAGAPVGARRARSVSAASAVRVSASPCTTIAHHTSPASVLFVVVRVVAERRRAAFQPTSVPPVAGRC